MLFHDGTREVIARIAAASSSEFYFFYPHLAMLPFLTARERVSKYDVFTPGYTSPSQYQEVCTSVLKRASWVAHRPELDKPQFPESKLPLAKGRRAPRNKELRAGIAARIRVRSALWTIRAAQARKDGERRCLRGYSGMKLAEPQTAPLQFASSIVVVER